MMQAISNILPRKMRIVEKPIQQVTDGLAISPSAGIKIDVSLMSDHEYFYVQRAILKGAIKAVQYEVVSED